MSQAPTRSNPYMYEGFRPDAQEPNNPVWLKAMVIHNGEKRAEHGVTWNYMKQLRTLLSADEMASFSQELITLISPLTLTEHGYRKSLGSWDQAEAWHEISSSITNLEEMGFNSFINSGTLLGLVREGELLKHDDDADLGVVIPGDTLEQVIGNLVNLARKLVSRKLMDRNQIERGCKHLCLNGALYTDLFPCFVLDGEFYAYPHGKIDPTIVLPFGSRKIEGQSISVPADPEAFLELCYGPDWQTPNSVYEYPWARSAEIFRAFNVEFDRQFAPVLPELQKLAS